MVGIIVYKYIKPSLIEELYNILWKGKNVNSVWMFPGIYSHLETTTKSMESKEWP